MCLTIMLQLAVSLATLKVKHETIIWDAARCHELVERLENLGIDERLTELLAKKTINVDET